MGTEQLSSAWSAFYKGLLYLKLAPDVSIPLRQKKLLADGCCWVFFTCCDNGVISQVWNNICPSLDVPRWRKVHLQGKVSEGRRISCHGHYKENPSGEPI